MPSYNMTCAISGLPVRAAPGVGAATAVVRYRTLADIAAGGGP